MTPAHDQAVREAADAELRGDAAEAFRLHRSVPMFRQSTHGDRLQQLADLGAATPGWMINRWLTLQARRTLWTGCDESAMNRVLQLVVPLVFPDGIQIEHIGCEYAEQVIPYINERDWVVRQVDVYDLGGLRRLLAGHASPELLDRSDQIEAWCGVPMRACRIEYVDPSRRAPIRVTDLASEERFDVLDLGAPVESGEHALGRIVPISCEPGAMFDWRPLVVSEHAAKAVAADPRRWLTTLHAEAVNGHLPPAFSYQPETSLTSDLPYRAWLALLGIPEPRWEDRDPATLIDRAVRTALALAAQGPDAVIGRRHEVAELVLDPAFQGSNRWGFAAPEFLVAWQRLTEALPDHARPRCEEMAMWCSAAPELPDEIA